MYLCLLSFHDIFYYHPILDAALDNPQTFFFRLLYCFINPLEQARIFKTNIFRFRNYKTSTSLGSPIKPCRHIEIAHSSVRST